jgi:hypothetical protein
MKKGEKKKQQHALKRRTQSKQARKQVHALGPMTAQRHIKQARSYPLEGCWTHTGWEEGGMAVVVVARRQPDGGIVFGNYLVDYYCLGLKDTYCKADIPPGQFRQEALPWMLRRAGTPVSISPALAHEIIYGGIEYAAQFGFRPHSDFKLSQYVLDPPELHPRSGTVEFGKDGKPFYMSGPYDNVDAIIDRLRRTVGEGNFHFMTQIGGPPPDWDEDDLDE